MLPFEAMSFCLFFRSGLVVDLVGLVDFLVGVLAGALAGALQKEAL